MIKILFFIPSLSEGGAEKVLCNLVNNMDQTKFDITVQTIEECNADDYLVPEIHYKAVNRKKTVFGKKLFGYWFRLCAELRLAYSFWIKDDYDMEVAYLETVATKIISQSTSRKAKKIAWVHCDLSRKEGMSEAAVKVGKQYKKFDKIICVSEDVRNGFYQLFGKQFNTQVLYNVIDDDEILNKAAKPVKPWKEERGKKLLAAGRLTEQKNFAHLIDCCARLRDDGFEFQLNILGEGPERKNLEKQIEQLELEEYVILQGYTDNPYVWMKNADVIICSSQYEGISSVVQEALILDKAVITTPCSGMRELLGDSLYGMIAEDSDNGLYNSIKRIMSDPTLQEHFEQKAAERKKYFQKNEILRQTENLFFDMVKE